MKKKFISVAMFLALAVSSPVWVGCADYDDDIANLQSQVDGLKQSVDVTTAEAISALQSAQGELQADIDELVANTGVTDTDVEALQGQVAALQAALDANNITEATNLSQQIQDLINKINDEVSPELEQVKTDLENQKTELEGQISAVSEDLSKKEEELKQLIAQNASQEDINGLQEQINTLSEDLKKLNKDFVDVSNRFTTVENWYKTNGTELAKLTSKVSQIESLLTYLDTQKQADIDKVTDPKVLAEILKLETTNDAVTTIQGQIGDAATEGSILYKLAELEGWKNSLMTELFKGTDYKSIADIQGDIKELQDALLGSTEGEEPTAGIQEQVNAIKAQMAKYDMIQSVVYLPNSDNGFKLNTKVLRVKNNGDFKVVAQSANTNTIQFRVSPASKAQDFIGENPKYTLSFDGQKIAKAFSAVTVDGEAKLVNSEAGIIEYKVNTSIEDNASYAVCAVIKGVDSKDTEGETVSADATNLTTTYFVATKEDVNVETVEIQGLDDYLNSANRYKLPYLDGNGNATSVDFGKEIKVVGKDKAGTEIVKDMVAEYGLPTLDYSLNTLTDADKSNDNWFAINGGVLTIPNADNTSIGHTVNVTITPNFGAFKTTATTAYVEVSRRNVDYTVADTKAMAWSVDAKYIPLGDAEMQNIVRATNLSTGDFHDKLTANSAPDFTEVILATGKQIIANNASATDTNNQAVKNDNTLYIAVPAKYYGDKEAEIKIELGTPGQTGVGTDTDIYTIHVKVAATTFPITSIEKNPARWSADGQTVTYRPQITYNTEDKDAIQAVANQFNIKDLMLNYDKIIAANADVKITAENISDTKGGVTFDSNNLTLTYDKTKTEGTRVVTLKFEIVYKDHNNKEHKFGATSCKIDVQSMSGTWKNPSSMNVTVNDLNQSYMIAAGATWVDFAGNTMWMGENPSANITEQDAKTKQFKYNFAKDPFSQDVYGLTKPSFSLVDDQNKPLAGTTTSGNIISEKYVELNTTTGEVSFTSEARQASFATPYVVNILIKANSPWGPIAGMDGNQVKMTLTIAAGAH